MENERNRLDSTTFGLDGSESDPINLLIHRVTAQIVRIDLTESLKEGRWTRRLFMAAGQRTEVGDYKLGQAEQVAYYPNKKNPWKWISFNVMRYHLRLWDVPDRAWLETVDGAKTGFRVVGAAHLERFTGIHRPQSIPNSFQRAMEFVVSSLQSAGYQVIENYHIELASTDGLEIGSILDKGN